MEEEVEEEGEVAWKFLEQIRHDRQIDQPALFDCQK